MIVMLGLLGVAIILFALSRAEGEPADYYEANYPELFAASADTRPKGGDGTKIAAPFTGGAVPKADAQPSGPILPNKERPR